MSPLIKNENGWKVDKPSFLVWFITMILGAAITIPGTYYGMKYAISDHDKRIATIESESKSRSNRLMAVEAYVTQDIIRTEWFRTDLNEMKGMIKEILIDQKKKTKREGG